MKIYDCFTFFNELDLLEIRLNELDDVVDYFVLVEGQNTFQGKTKELIFENNKDRYSKFLHKIIHVVIPSAELPPGDAWLNERKSFNYCLTKIEPSNDDIIILSALDEIPKKETVLESLDKTPCVVSMNFYYFFLNTRYWTNNRNNNIWNGSIIYKYDQIKNSGRDLYDIFLKKEGHKINGGWHFSFLGDAKNAVSKVNSYSHSEYNNLDESFYLDKIENLKDPFDRNHFTGFDFFEDVDNLPVFVRNNLDRLSKYIKS